MKIVERINDDMLFLLTYMASVATADIDRDKIFYYAGAQQEYEASRYFRKIHTLATKWGYEYAKACKYISQKMTDTYLSKFFGRLSTTLASGEPEKDFLINEKATLAEIYSNEYERNIESLRKWTDGYTALLVSVTLVVTIILVSTMIYGLGNIEAIAFLTTVMIAFICWIAIFIIYKAAPAEKKVHSLGQKSKEQEKIEIARILLWPFGIITLAVLFYLKARVQFFLLAISGFMLPIGILAMLDDRKIDDRDNSFPSFVKTLGTLAGTTGITIGTAMENLDRETVGCLKSNVDKLHEGLSLGLRPKLCWEKFIGDTGSELINRCSKIFNDAIELGGNPTDIGNIVSSSSLAVVLLRMKRKLVSSGFRALAIILHAVMTGLLIFIMEIISKFSDLVARMNESHASMNGGTTGIAGMGMSMFNVAGSVPFLYSFTIAIVLILTVADTIVVKVVEGGDNSKLCFYGGVMCGISGLVMIFIPPLVSKVFTF